MNSQNLLFSEFMSLPIYILSSTQPLSSYLDFPRSGIKNVCFPNTEIKEVSHHHLELFLDQSCVVQGSLEFTDIPLSLSLESWD